MGEVVELTHPFSDDQLDAIRHHIEGLRNDQRLGITATGWAYDHARKVVVIIAGADEQAVEEACAKAGEVL